MHPQIHSAHFEKSSPSEALCPQHTLPEYALIGRSNVGKSTLLNYLTNHTKLSKTSSTPGKTQLINHFLINNNWYFVDLPGFGYASTSKKIKKNMDRLIQDYFLNRKNLVNTFFLIDIRLAPQPIDLEFMKWLGVNTIPFSIVFTKIDKVSKNQLASNIKGYQNELLTYWQYLPPHFVTSATKKIGKKAILTYIMDLNKKLELRE